MYDVDYFPSGKNVVVRNAIITTVPRAFGTTSPATLQRLRETYTQAVMRVSPTLGTKKRRIYVSRKLARGRKVVNENAVIALLAEYGFEVVTFDNLEFSAQVKMMAETEALVSIHGAALTNMIFMPSIGQVLEFVPHKRPFLDFNIVRMSFKHDPCYMRLASSMGHRYFLQPCTPVNIPDRTTHMADIIVDIVLLQKNIELMLAGVQDGKA
jgi:capsular polysaccharide biosynthesis protein